ncbi:glycerophosphodiester phosphodiesterase [Elizabethkingia meningoseptica]|uniref:glycerophosphodiester phosphodiesterase n=1 Tax=Elizabethkingia meningoseptica TaxID=238 RepID=UPI000332C3F0|nr:glycerophosphodiester phosphodiesterase family protein [Elizabethkingia meningoseptica]AQX05664.1 glycerophosphodiester phosphodiesterase [Elizabethkingia meningoseptica]AQX47707.1 glycerophosphodiester phosphodiesterase [Elizabethkingia meningoseptica]EJK5328930.1 glycerophosphodiester phosphodiesterase [Elizabethkingia meningoseptica]EOR30669.1 glycerophosphoryl diester phosphodiesterase [Elizabethkingia meningoseptica ATCC 13253 = NBRC 12535]KUY24030.1 glycerophosphodiester phosphodieste
MKKYFIGALSIFSFMAMAQTQIIAHRGFWKTEGSAQNSIHALQGAQKLKVYGSEFDVRLTKDGVVVVNHDEDINKVNIAETPFKELRKQKLANGEVIPTLEEYLKQGKKDPALQMILEIKPLASEASEKESVEKSLALVKKNKLENQTQYISFSLFVCKELKRLNPKAKVQYLKGDLSPKEIKDLGIDGIDYHYSVFEKNPTWLKEAQDLKLITNAWTVDSPDIFQKLKAQGIDFVTTNVPDVFQKL